MIFLTYWLWPNPAGWHYQDPKVFALFGFCVLLILLSFIIRVWRARLKNSMTKKLSSSWSSTLFWFGIVAAVLTICRVETIQFLSMRLLWAFWFLAFLLYVVLQFLSFRRRHYTVMERTTVIDEREKYLPKRK